MEHHAAAEHLEVIRTLMERSALYRRTLAPIMLYIGSVGTLAGALGLSAGIESWRAFVAWWLTAAFVAVAGAFAVARRQALQDNDRFWSPPTVRVTQAMVPPLAAGFVFSLAMLADGFGQVRWLFVLCNALFYGCAVHAAGFFMPRGMKLFGWLIIVLAGAALLALPSLEATPSPRLGHAVMGVLFGLLHLAYGVYLYVTEPRKSLP
jgi:hypothetical protein